MPKIESFASSPDELVDRLKKNLKNRLNRLPIRSTGWENYQILTQYSLKNKESNKQTMRNSEIGWGRYDRNKPKYSVFELAPMNSNWTKVLGRPHFLPLAWCEQLWNWPWQHSKMNYTLALHWTADEPIQGSKMNQARKGNHGGAIWKKKYWVHVTPLR